MNKNFAEWYRVVDIEPNHQRLQDRWKGIENYCIGDVSCPGIMNLVKLFFNLPISDDFKESFIDPFYKVDNAFPHRDNGAELSVLAGATLVFISENDINQLKTFALLAIAAASFKRKEVIPSILNVLRCFLNEDAFALRDEESINTTSISGPSIKSLTNSLKLVEDSNSWAPPNEIAKQLSSYLISLSKIFVQINSSINESLSIQKIYREDSQILWWLSSEFSKDMHKSINELKKAAACVVIGKELADLIETLPGPYSAKAVLYKMLSFHSDDSHEIMLSTAINQTNKEWRQKTLEIYDVEKTKEITPILVAISESLRVEKVEEWLSAYKHLTGITAKSTKISLVDLAYQVYLECLLLKAYVS